MIKLRVPATTANMGPGFDCIGMAFKLYNYLSVEEIDSDEKVIITINNKQEGINNTENNLIYKSFETFYEEILPGIKIPHIAMTQEDYVPLTRGLGSSAACIVAGLMAANEISHAGLKKNDIARLAAKIEGHPDNSTPAVMGGIIVGAMSDDKLEYLKIDTQNLITDGIKFCVMIPNFKLSTEVARSILPQAYDIKDVIFNTSRAALLVASLMSRDYNKLSVAMNDKLHQPYRQKIIPNMQEIFDIAKENGAIGTFLSGAGPTLISVHNAKGFKQAMENDIKDFSISWSISNIEPDNSGAVILPNG